MPRPHVVVHVAVSLDGSTTGFAVDVGTYYRLAGTWHENATLTGADTLLAQEAAIAAAPRPGPAPDGPLLVVVDSRARVHGWTSLRELGYWSDVVVGSAEGTPPRPADDRVEQIVTGADRVDLHGLLAALGDRPGIEVVRVDSGGGLAGALLTGGLVDEISLLVHPALAGTGGRPWFGAAAPAAALVLERCEQLPDGLVWLRYRVAP